MEIKRHVYRAGLHFRAMRLKTTFACTLRWHACGRWDSDMSIRRRFTAGPKEHAETNLDDTVCRYGDYDRRPPWRMLPIDRQAGECCGR